MMTITSRQNAWFQRVRDAIRDHRDEIAIEGPKPVADAIAAGWRAIAVFADTDEVPFATHRLSTELLEALAETRTPQNVIGLFARPAGRIDFAAAKPVVALDGVQDPGNVGTIVRLAAAFDAAGVVLLPGCADAFAPKAIRASAGAILNVPVETMNALRAHDRPILYADAHGESFVPPRNSILVFGSEGSGVSAAIRSVGRAVAVRTSGRVESLNVAAAAAILLWQTM